MGVKPLQLPTRQFSAILEQRTTAFTAYEGSPLAGISDKRSGDVLATIVREMDAYLHPAADVCDPIPGTGIDGQKLGVNQAAYDWLRDGRRIECKSSRLSWSGGNQCWRFLFRDVKFPYGKVRSEAAFDELLLVLCTPERLHIYRHDWVLGISSQGMLTARQGHQICIYSSKGMDD